MLGRWWGDSGERTASLWSSVAGVEEDVAARWPRRGSLRLSEEQDALARVEPGGSNVSPYVTQDGEGSRTRNEDDVATWSVADKDETVSKRPAAARVGG